MKKLALIIPLAFAITGTAFASYSFLDTFVVVKNAKKITFSSTYDIPLGPTASSSSNPSSSKSSKDSKTSSSSSSSSTSSTPTVVPSEHQYYEGLTAEQIEALFTPTKEFT